MTEAPLLTVLTTSQLADLVAGHIVVLDPDGWTGSLPDLGQHHMEALREGMHLVLISDLPLVKRTPPRSRRIVDFTCQLAARIAGRR